MTFQEAVQQVRETERVAYAIEPRMRGARVVGANVFLVHWNQPEDAPDEAAVGLWCLGGAYGSSEGEDDWCPEDEAPEEAQVLEYRWFSGSLGDIPFDSSIDVVVDVLEVREAGSA